MLNVQIELRALKACIISAPKKDVRYYLNSIMVQPRANDVLCVSTDGHRMTVAQSNAEGYQGESFDLVIPRDKAELAIKTAVKGQETVLLESDGSGYRLNGIPFTALDGKYPAWRHVIPEIELFEGQERAAHYNPAYLVDAAKSIGAYVGVSPAKSVLGGFRLYQNGPSGGIVRGIDPGCFVVVMPQRMKGLENISPDTGWTADPVKLTAVS